ncbi:histidine kinase [Amycolatopsis antarctica]|uniref:Histidine kinase n=1 Tax=Amycolatopsis antarctica TaxID=1854586 RepID=A0A263D0G6_9PSEU|nr:histidine kinase [Amycolatopsis antarctica]OZM71930.1 histidine kinase [Amycolatopsis antarctica]
MSSVHEVQNAQETGGEREELKSTDSAHRSGDRSTAFPQSLLSPMAPRLAMLVTTVVFGGIAVLALARVLFDMEQPWPDALGAVYLVAFMALQLGYFSSPKASLRPPVTYAALVVQACLAYLPMLQFGVIWLGMPGFLAGSVLLSLRPRVSVPLYVLIAGSVGLLDSNFGPSTLPPAYVALFSFVSTTITALVVFGLTRLARLVTKLNANREELARLAVADERLRFSRDLHDLLGLSLSAITLKSELAKRLMEENPQRAAQEIDEILLMSRKALGDVRSVASGYRKLSLDEECRSARGVLMAADVEVSIERTDGVLPDSVGTVLATVLREGVTNVLRHSSARWCAITVRTGNDEARMEVVNDGVPGSADTLDDTDGGNGIRNLSHRVALLGGRLAAHEVPDGRHLLLAVIPLGATPGGADRTVANGVPAGSRTPWRPRRRTPERTAG